MNLARSTSIIALTQLASRFVSRLASQQCTRMPQNGPEGPFPPICVHFCVPTATRTILARRNSVHKCPETAPRGPILPFVYTIAIPRPPTTQAHGATVYTNAPKRRRGAILADLCTLLTVPTAARATGRGHGSHDIDDPMVPVMPGRLGPEAHAAKAVARSIVWSFRTPSASWHRTRPWRWRCRGGPPYLGWCPGSL